MHTRLHSQVRRTCDSSSLLPAATRGIVVAPAGSQSSQCDELENYAARHVTRVMQVDPVVDPVGNAKRDRMRGERHAENFCNLSRSFPHPFEIAIDFWIDFDLNSRSLFKLHLHRSLRIWV